MQTKLYESGIVGLVRGMVEALVDQPKRVMVMAGADAANGVTLHVKVADGDLGKVIGKQGRTAKALRSIVGAAAHKHGLKVGLSITGPDGVTGKLEE
jgi:predicted RNA-binding protein YlqC (UPF0109 family)